jgi:hypothetical protein
MLLVLLIKCNRALIPHPVKWIGQELAGEGALVALEALPVLDVGAPLADCHAVKLRKVNFDFCLSGGIVRNTIYFHVIAPFSTHLYKVLLLT